MATTIRIKPAEKAGAGGGSGYGSSGYSGISGYSGLDGTFAASGYSGFSGLSGYSGISGYGTSGYSGISGYRGISGYSGSAGLSGYSGAIGTTGTSGYSGISGYSGAAGSAGSQGTSGCSGLAGYSGYSGIQGTSGYSGLSGYSGAGFTIGADITFQTTSADGSDNNSRFYFQNADSQNLAVVWHSTQTSPEQTPNADGRFTSGKVYNSVYNDIADFLELEQPISKIEYGKVYVRGKDGSVRLSSCYCEKGIIGIASDMYGFGIGTKQKAEKENRQLPICIGGFILAHVDSIYEPGTPLTCNGGGTLTEISQEYKIRYPERIIGTFYKEEKEKEWNGIKVNGRHWVKV